MVRNVVARKPVASTAVLAIVVGGVALVWHLLACVESPMAYSPNGKDLAFVTMEPYGGDNDIMLRGTHVYRLMVLSEDNKLRTLEETATDMLTAPAFSSDGKYLCYLRIRLGTEEALKRLKERFEKCKAWHDEMSGFAWDERPPLAPTSVPAAFGNVVDRALPSFEELREWGESMSVMPAMPGTLVERDAETGKVVSTTPVDVPSLIVGGGLPVAYSLIRPQYAAESRCVYYCGGNMIFAAEPAKPECRIVAVPALAAALSPDGSVLAVLQQKALAFIETSGERATYRRLEKPISPAGLAWADSKTLVALEPAAVGADLQLRFFDPDGTLRKTVPVPLPTHGKHEEDDSGALAIAPGAQQVVVAFKNDTFFLNADGTLVKHWHAEDEQLAQPTFAPDGQRVVFKVMQGKEGKSQRAAAIAFFTPAGEEVSRVPIPEATLPTSQPASQPAGNR